ncbi:nuclear transport factor 2 family protein [Streptomyces sp. NPDC057552]|uniref:nuclear transport factor 2 family protein n=1 Tax=Streptomyces sp. NPDC057552 TaxID=3350537 RepID=UPI003691E6B1
MNSNYSAGAGPWALPADPVTAAGVDHIRLVYDYLNAGDFDACASLLHDDVEFELPGRPTARGRTAVLHAHRTDTALTTRHEIDRIVAHDHCVVAVGRIVGPGTEESSLRFIDCFGIADDAMVRSCTRYYHTTP